MTIAWILLAANLTTDSLIIAIVGYLVVFASLVLLFWFFSFLPKLIYIKKRKRRKDEGTDGESGDFGIPGDTTAAISMALHLYLSEMHDEESGVLTIKKVSKVYSPWSSKIYAVRNQFNRL